jgi:thiol:disulfide interchange protein DsbD
MKIIFSLLSFVFFTVSLSGQMLKPVKWEYEVIELKDKLYEVHFKAKMDQKWAIYSQHTNEGGPIPTSFNFENNDAIELVKGVDEVGEMLSGFDELFETTVKKFKKSVDFVQTVRLKNEGTNLKGYVTFMTCDDNRCLPPSDEEFSIPIN